MFQELVVRGVVDELLSLMKEPAVRKKHRQEFLQLINNYRGKVIENDFQELKSSIYFDVVNLAKSWNIPAEKIYALISKDGKATDTPIIVEQIFRLVMEEELSVKLEQEKLNYQQIKLWISRIMNQTNNALVSIVQEWDAMFFLKEEAALKGWEEFKEEADKDFKKWLNSELYVLSYSLADREVLKNKQTLDNEMQSAVRQIFEQKITEYEHQFIKRKLKLA